MWVWSSVADYYRSNPVPTYCGLPWWDVLWLSRLPECLLIVVAVIWTLRIVSRDSSRA
jgi:hypothetical protein